MGFNGDSVTAEGMRKVTTIGNFLMRQLAKVAEDIRKTAVSASEASRAEKQQKKLLASYGVSEDFQKHMSKGGKMRSIEVHDADYLDFARELKKYNVPFMASDVLGDNTKCVRYRDVDSERVELAAAAVKEQRSIETEYSPERFRQKFSGQSIQSISGIDMVELELLRHYAVKQNLQFAAVASGDSECSILFTDVDKMDTALKNMAWQLTGEQGERVREQISYRIAGRDSLDLSHEAAEREFYIVSKDVPQNYVVVTAEDYQLYKNDKVVETVSRTDGNYYDKAQRAIAGLSNPVKLDKDEWQQEAQRENIIEARQEVIALGVSAAAEVAQEVDRKQHTAWELYHAKVSLDNSYGLETDNSLTSTESFAAFFSLEIVNDTHELEERNRAEGRTHAAEASEYLHDKKLEVVKEVEIAEKKVERTKEARTEEER